YSHIVYTPHSFIYNPLATNSKSEVIVELGIEAKLLPVLGLFLYSHILFLPETIIPDSCSYPPVSIPLGLAIVTPVLCLALNGNPSIVMFPLVSEPLLLNMICKVKNTSPANSIYSPSLLI